MRPHLSYDDTTRILVDCIRYLPRSDFVSRRHATMLAQIKLNAMHSIQSNSIQFNSIQFNSIQFNSIQFNSIQFNSINSIQLFISDSPIKLLYSYNNYCGPYHYTKYIYRNRKYQTCHQNTITYYRTYIDQLVRNHGFQEGTFSLFCIIPQL